MKIFTAMYDMALRWSVHPKAVRMLATISFLESVIFPIPVDVMLAPMCLAKPHKAWTLAGITSLASIVGGVFGYALGFFAFDWLVLPMLEVAGYTERYEQAVAWFTEYGFWVVFIAGFSPIPYKVFTVTAGALHMALLPFILASAVGRSARFFLVAGLIYWGGESMEKKLRSIIDQIGWATVAMLLIAYLVYVY
jgi:membrane protein YqaA with SNARE-associated domain